MEQNQSQNQKNAFKYYWLKAKRFSSLHPDSDGQATIARIKESVVFRGMNVWILAFAIIIASVGLNVNVSAFIVGAMLISPLMGPIMGVGLAVGVYDFSLLKKSLQNLGYMVTISLIASTLYFLLSPLSDAQSELLARTSPSIYDVLIAFFGGLTGIIAFSRKGEKTTVIAGVAIATSLMPPLCTAGYGIAIGEWTYFFGAFYLFFINSFFIALATALFVRYIKLPKCTEINPRKEKKFKQYIYIFAIIICIPSLFSAFGMIQESAFNSNAIRYVSYIEKNFLPKHVHIVSSKRFYGGRDSSEIALTTVGVALSREQIVEMQNFLNEYDLNKTRLKITQIANQSEYYSDAENHLIGDLMAKNEKLTKELSDYKLRMQLMSIPNKQIAKEMKVQFDGIDYFSFGKMEYTHIRTLAVDSVPTMCIYWNTPETADTNKFNQWLRVRLDMKNLRIHHKHFPQGSN